MAKDISYTLPLAIVFMRDYFNERERERERNTEKSYEPLKIRERKKSSRKVIKSDNFYFSKVGTAIALWGAIFFTFCLCTKKLAF